MHGTESYAVTLSPMHGTGYDSVFICVLDEIACLIHTSIERTSWARSRFATDPSPTKLAMANPLAQEDGYNSGWGHRHRHPTRYHACEQQHNYITLSTCGEAAFPSQWGASTTQLPRPEQLRKHAINEQSSPNHPGKHSHLQATKWSSTTEPNLAYRNYKSNRTRNETRHHITCRLDHKSHYQSIRRRMSCGRNQPPCRTWAPASTYRNCMVIT
jgi:hypothetical protein